MEDFRQATILLVEDDPGDQKLVKKSLEKQKIANYLVIANNGEEALDYLSNSKNGSAAHPMPDLILLDLNMPGMGGKEFLRCVKNDDQLKIVPVVILTTSDSDQDVLDTYKLSAAGYIKKPVSLNEFQNVLSKLEDYWFVVCKHTSGQPMMTCVNSTSRG